jgi:hypothetical protein
VTAASPTETATDARVVDRRSVALWELGGFFVINVGAGLLHLAYELSGFAEPVAIFGSVNESTFEHLKLYYWPALAYALVQHAYTRHKVNNFWWGKGVAIIATPIVLMLAYYSYLGVVLPMYGQGFLWANIGTGALGVLAGNVLAYRIMTGPDMGRRLRLIGIGLIVAYGIAAATAAWFPPQFFLYENFFGYEYTGEFGFLDDYSDYLVFSRP